MDLSLVFARMAGVSLKLEINRDIVIQATHLVQEEAEDSFGCWQKGTIWLHFGQEFFGQWLHVVKKLHTS